MPRRYIPGHVARFLKMDRSIRYIWAKMNRRIKRIVQVLLLIFSGWFGEWSYAVSGIRSVLDWMYGGSAFPRIAQFSWLYGYTWRVAFYRGGIGLEDLLNGIGLLLIPALAWTFYEFFKGKV